jgi:hypothetical protein
VKSHTTASFRKRLAALPAEVRAHTRTAYQLFRANPHHTSLNLKRVHAKKPVFSARVGRNYRVVGFMENDGVIVWFWIGPHEQYERLLSNV